MVDKKRRRHQPDLRLKAEQSGPSPLSGISPAERLPENRIGIGAAFFDEEIALMISIWDEENERKSKTTDKRSR
jgi:hypothetical protein